jgi:hypothetical protein
MVCESGSQSEEISAFPRNLRRVTYNRKTGTRMSPDMASTSG